MPTADEILKLQVDSYSLELVMRTGERYRVKGISPGEHELHLTDATLFEKDGSERGCIEAIVRLDAIDQVIRSPKVNVKITTNLDLP